jgi:hypothetical protein
MKKDRAAAEQEDQRATQTRATQTTRTGVEIPVPKREDFLRDIGKVAPPLADRPAGPNDDESPS